MDSISPDDPFNGIILEKILPKESYVSDYKVDKFTLPEIHKIISVLTEEEWRMVQYWFFAGPRPSEMIGLEWPDFLMERRLVYINRAVVYRRIKSTKTDAGTRYIELLEPAYEALIAQKKFTYKEGGRVFINPVKNIPWETDRQIRDWREKFALERWWVTVTLTSADIRMPP